MTAGVKIRRNRFKTGAVATAFILLAGCVANRPIHFAAVPDEESIEYADPFHWVLRPEAGEDSKGVDLFYVYPTVVADRDHPLMSWGDAGVREKTERIARQQTGLFAGFANVYAPYVRQLEFHRIWAAIQDESFDVETIRPGINDVRAAFRWFRANRGTDRPFLLLGHSQGAMDLFQMMKEDFDDPGIASNLVAAYLIGTAVRPGDLEGSPHLKLAAGETDTGVIVAYNTEAPGAAASPFTGPGTRGINPLNWRTDGEPASRSLHLGAVFFDGEGRVARDEPGFCGAVLHEDRGALVVDLADAEDYGAPELMGEGVLHMNDLYFFYRNLEHNARRRVAAFRAKQESQGR